MKPLLLWVLVWPLLLPPCFLWPPFDWFELAEELELLDDELDPGAVVVVGCVVAAVEVHDSETPATGPLMGSEAVETWLPAGTFTVKVSVLPPASVTVTVHVSALAAGSAARPDTTRVTLVAAMATTSFRLLNTMAYLLPPSV